MENLTQKFRDLLGSLEQIAEDQHGMLAGGFAIVGGSALYSNELQDPPVINNGCTNNCNGGNCIVGCG